MQNPSQKNLPKFSHKKWLSFGAAAIAITSVIAISACGKPDKVACNEVRFADVGWSDITATTGMAKAVLTDLGFVAKDQVLSVPITYQSLKNKDIDVFLGNWMPTMEADIKPYLEDKSVEVLRTNLEGAKYTLAVPTYLAEKGLKDFKDIAKFKKELDGKIYGIESGNDGNRLIISMLNDKEKWKLDGFQIVETSEQGMLAQVERATAKNEAIVFLGWAPHPMNVKHSMTYLTGGDDVFGANFGEAKVHTNIRAGYATECPNIGKFLSNLSFTVEQENAVMEKIANKEDPVAAGKDWLVKHPEVLQAWLKDVTAKDGKPGYDVIKTAWGL